MRADELNRYYTVKEAAHILNCPPQSIYRFIHHNYIPAIKLGEMYRIPKKKFEELLDVLEEV